MGASLHGVHLVDLTMRVDERGSFTETFRQEWFPGAPPIVQSNLSISRAGVLRGLHVHRRQADYWCWLDGSAFVELDGEAEVLPGVLVVPTPGHTEGHQSFVVRLPDGSVVVAGQSHDTTTGYAADVLALRAHRDGRPSPLPDLRGPWVARLQELDPRMVVLAHDYSVWMP